MQMRKGDGRFGKAESDDCSGSPLLCTPLIFHWQKSSTGFAKKAFLKGLLADPNIAKVSVANRVSRQRNA